VRISERREGERHWGKIATQKILFSGAS